MSFIIVRYTVPDSFIGTAKFASHKKLWAQKLESLGPKENWGWGSSLAALAPEHAWGTSPKKFYKLWQMVKLNLGLEIQRVPQYRSNQNS